MLIIIIPKFALYTTNRSQKRGFQSTLKGGQQQISWLQITWQGNPNMNQKPIICGLTWK